MDMKKYETEKIVLVMRDGTLPHSFQRDSGIRRLTPYHGLLSLYCRGERGEKKRDGRCPSALLHTGETAAAGLRCLGHSSEADGLLRSVFIVTVLTLEKLTVGQC